MASSDDKPRMLRQIAPRTCARGWTVSELFDNPQFSFEFVNRIIIDDWYAGFQRNDQAVGDGSTDRDVKRKEEAAGLAGKCVAEIDADVVARIPLNI